jgi:hypothetical protein
MPKRASNISKLLPPAQKKGLSTEKITDLAFSGKIMKKQRKNAGSGRPMVATPGPFFYYKKIVLKFFQKVAGLCSMSCANARDLGL